MDILITVQHYYPLMSGVPVVVKYLAEGLQSIGHNVSVVTTTVKGYPRQEILNGIKIYRFNIFHNKIKGYSGEKNEYIEFVKSFPCDVIINECTQCETTDLLLKHIDNITVPVILHSHGFSGLALKPFIKKTAIKNKVGNFYNWVRWKLYYKSFYKYMVKYDKLLCLSDIDTGKDYMERYAKDKVEVLENAANKIFFNEKTKETVINKYTKLTNTNYLINVANYKVVKNQKMLLEAFYKASIEDCSLVIIGSNVNSVYFKLQAKKKELDLKYGIKDVHFLTRIDREDIPSIIEHAKIYLASSNTEAYSISIIEAMARGIPFISTDVGNARLLPGGIIIKTMEEMSIEIEKLLNDEDRRIALGKKGQQYAEENCTEETAVKKIDRILKSIVN